MYHDDREINADKMIEAFEDLITMQEELSDLSADGRLMLILVIVIRIADPSIPQPLTKELMGHPLLLTIKNRTFQNLLVEARYIFQPGSDATDFLTHLIAKLISVGLGIDYRHPKLVAALVGTVQSTLSTPLYEAMPTTGELSLGLLGSYPKDSFPMFGDIGGHLRTLIRMRLAVNEIRAKFISPAGHGYTALSTFLLDAPYTDQTRTFDALQEVLDGKGQARLVLIQNWTQAGTSLAWRQLRDLIEGRAHIEAIINFSSLPVASDHCTAIIINTAPQQRGTLYVDVSMFNKALPAMDGIERMLLAGCIYNLWQGRAAHRSNEYLSSEVVRFINSYFSEGFRPISGLCNTSDKQPKTISKKTLVSRKFITGMPEGASERTLTDNSKLIRDRLASYGGPCCIYVIGNNGEGKSCLLRDVVYQLAADQQRSVGLPLSHADRFPRLDNSIKHFFEYKGARTTQIVKEIGVISSQPDKIRLLSECLALIGFGLQIFLTLKSELSQDHMGRPRRDDLDLDVEADMRYLNSDSGAITDYTANFIREGHRTTAFDNLSSGEQSILGLLIKIIAAQPEQTTFLIDEPEISLHVSWQQRLPRILSLLSRRLNASFVVATHSAILVANAAEGDICYVSNTGKLKEIPVDERHSVETLLMDGFGTYTPHNREVHERCAKLVASLISAANGARMAEEADEAIKKLEEFEATILESGQHGMGVRHAADLNLVEKTLGAVRILLNESENRHA